MPGGNNAFKDEMKFRVNFKFQYIFGYQDGTLMMRNHLTQIIGVDMIVSTGIPHVGKHGVHDPDGVPLAQADIFARIEVFAAFRHDSFHFCDIAGLFGDDSAGSILKWFNVGI